MATPNPQLEAALAQFAAQPGTTPDHEAQLRAAVIADADKLNLLNQQAATGQLKNFALEAPGGAPNLTGAYDKAAGVVTVPAASFQPRGTAAGGDLKAVVGLQAISVDFAHKTWQDPAGQTHTVNQDMVSNLQSTLNGSPVLAAQIKDAVTQGHVQHFSLLGNSMAAGATYDGNTQSQDGSPKGINLPPLGLQTKTAANAQGKYDPIDMTFVLGHEIQHGFNDSTKDQATRTFMQGISTQAQVRGPVHDYTDELRPYIQSGREDEAKAEIAGWNALLSRERQHDPTMPGLDLMANTGNGRTLDFVQRDQITKAISINAGLTFNSDGSLSQTPANIAAMGQHYFDRPSHVHSQPGQRPVGIGEHKPNGTSDYTNYYGTWALEQIVVAEDKANVQYQGARPKIAIDMAGLGLKEDLIEMEGLDLGANKTPRPYLDTSQTPAVPGNFQHTQDGSVNPQHDHQYVPIDAPAAASPTMHGPRSTGGDQQSERNGEHVEMGSASAPPVERQISSVIAAAAARQIPADMRDPNHPAHGEFTRTLSEVHRMESGSGIQPGPHSELAAAAPMVEAESKRQGITNVEMTQDGRINGIARYTAFEPEKTVSISSKDAMASSMEQYSAQWAGLRSPHLLSVSPPHRRTREEEQELSQLSPNDQAMFAKIRTDTPAQITDNVVLQALLAAKKDGVDRPDQIGRTSMFGDKLLVEGTTPGARGMVDVTDKAPAVQEGVQQTQSFNQMREQQLAQEALSRKPDGPDGPTIGPKA